MQRSSCRAAGIILYRKRNGIVEVLGLEALEVFKNECGGIYDLPKGQRDEGETPVECAYRECFEETGLRPDKLEAGPYYHRNIWFWLAECDGTPVLKVNPDTLQKEHLSHAWLDCDQIINDCLTYLKLPLIWAKEQINNGL